MRLILAVSIFFVTLSAGEYWIQVASVKSVDALTPEFMKKVNAIALEKRVVVGETWHRLYLGKFEREIDALEVLPSIRCSVASDAYIVSSLMVPAQKKAVAKAAPTNMDVSETKMEKMPVVSTDSGEVEKMPVISTNSGETKRVVATKESVQKAYGIENGERCECICDARAFKKAKMREALAYYKNSKRYDFSYREKKGF